MIRTAINIYAAILSALFMLIDHKTLAAETTIPGEGIEIDLDGQTKVGQILPLIFSQKTGKLFAISEYRNGDKLFYRLNLLDINRGSIALVGRPAAGYWGFFWGGAGSPGGTFLKIDGARRLAFFGDVDPSAGGSHYNLITFDLSANKILYKRRIDSGGCLSYDQLNHNVLQVTQSSVININNRNGKYIEIFNFSNFYDDLSRISSSPPASMVYLDSDNGDSLNFLSTGLDPASLASLISFDFQKGNAPDFETGAYIFQSVAVDSATGDKYGLAYSPFDASESRHKFFKIDSSFKVFKLLASTKGNMGACRSTIADNDRLYTLGASNRLTSIDIAANRSWYIKSAGVTDAALYDWMYRAGYVVGQRDWAGAPGDIFRSVLDFYGPMKVGGVFGASGEGRFLSTAKIQRAVLNYAKGWFNATRPNKDVKLKIIVGTSNSPFKNPTYRALTAEHGQAWAKLTAAINAELKTRGYAAQVSAVGGMDIEADWSTPTEVKDWRAGYGSGEFVNFGDAGVCPQDGKSRLKPASCGGLGPWKQDDIIAVSGSTVIPEIYSTGGRQARQWQTISLYAAEHTGKPLPIEAPMSQTRMCFDHPDVDAKTGKIITALCNTSGAAWSQLDAALKGNLKTSQSFGPTTDITRNQVKDGKLTDISSARATIAGADAKTAAGAQTPETLAHAAIMRDIEAREKQGYGPAPEPDFVGVSLAAEGLPYPKGLFYSWTGKLDGAWRTIYAGYAFADPSQGLVIVDGGAEKYVRTPDATGPLKIISERGGILTLQSEAGTFDAPTPETETEVATTVHTAGGKTYRFDVRKGEFID